MKFDLYCQRCQYYSIQARQGIICGLSGSKPNFKNVCPHFILDKARENELLKIQNASKVREQKRRDYTSPYHIDESEYFSRPIIGLAIGIIIILIAPLLERLLTVFGLTNFSMESVFLLISLPLGLLYFLVMYKYISLSQRMIVLKKNEISNILDPGFVFINFINERAIKIDLNNIIVDWEKLSEYELKRNIYEYYYNTLNSTQT